MLFALFCEIPAPLALLLLSTSSTLFFFISFFFVINGKLFILFPILTLGILDAMKWLLHI